MKRVKPDAILAINFPENGKLRSRKVVKRSNARITGKYPSWKMNRMIQWESPNEENAILLMEADYRILHFNEQPCEIVFQLNGEVHRHYPDFFIQKQLNRSFIEVKSRAAASAPEIETRTQFLTKSLPHFGYHYQVFLDDELRVQPRLDNIKLILKHGRCHLNAFEREALRKRFTQDPNQRWGTFDITTRMQVCRMILDGILVVDVNLPISNNSIIRPNFN